MRASIELTLAARTKKKGKWFVSSCDVLDVHSQGRTRPKAEQNLRDALESFLVSCYERGTLEAVLRDLQADRPRSLAKNDDPEFGGDDAQWKRLKEWHKRLYAAGWAGLTWPKEYGGRGATFIEQVIFQQELGRLGLPMGCNTLGVIMTGPALMQWGTDDQKKRYLQPILAGDEIWCEGMS